MYTYIRIYNEIERQPFRKVLALDKLSHTHSHTASLCHLNRRTPLPAANLNNQTRPCDMHKKRHQRTIVTLMLPSSIRQPRAIEVAVRVDPVDALHCSPQTAHMSELASCIGRKDAHLCRFSLWPSASAGPIRLQCRLPNAEEHVIAFECVRARTEHFQVVLLRCRARLYAASRPNHICRGVTLLTLLLLVKQ